MERKAPPEQPTGTELAARREMLPAELVAPNRAGAIVAEFVNSIVEEAQARALEMIRSAAGQDDAGQREALESADRMRARIDVMAEELETAVGQLRQESARLAALHEQTTLASLTGSTIGSDTDEREALAQVAASLERGEPAAGEEPTAEQATAEEHDEDEAHEVEVMAGHEDEDDEHEPEAEHEEIAEEPVEGHAEEEPDDEPATVVVGDEPAADEPGPDEQLAVEDDPQPVAEDEPQLAVEEEPQPVAEHEPRAEAQPVAADEPGPEERLAIEDEPGPEERLGFAEEPRSEVQPAAGPEIRPAELGIEDAPIEDAPPDDAPPDDEPLEDEPEVVGEPAAESLSDEDELAQDQERFARMSDVELADAYSDALDRMDTESAETPQGARLLRYAGSALGEALTRPSFADIGQGAPALEPVPRMGRRRRRRAEAINTLRRACAQAIEEMSAEEAVR